MRVTEEERTTLARVLRWHARYCRAVSTPFYADLMELMADEVAAGSPIAELMAPDATDSELGYRLRVMGGLHRMVLAGDAPEPARHFPTTGGDGDAVSAWPRIRELLAEPHAAVLDALTRPPQTNEVGRSAPLVGGFLVVARDTGLPLRVLELGSSAGLNDRLGRSPLHAGSTPAARPRRGPGRAPARRPSGGSGLRPGSRPARRHGLGSARRAGASQLGRSPTCRACDRLLGFRSDRPGWCDARRRSDRRERSRSPGSERPRAGYPGPQRATAKRWSYLTAEEQASVRSTLRAAGERADAAAPLAWLRLESAPTLDHTELRLTTWPDGDEQFLARASFHIGPVDWLV